MPCEVRSPARIPVYRDRGLLVTRALLGLHSLEIRPEALVSIRTRRLLVPRQARVD